MKALFHSLRLLCVLFCISALTLSSNGATLFWDADGVAPVAGGLGTWNTTSAFWATDASGTSYQAWNNANVDSATFSGTAGAVAIGVGVTVNKITTTVTGYSFTGSPVITFSGVDSGVDAQTGTTTLSANYTGALLTKTGAGRLTLNNANNTLSKYKVLAGHVSTAAISRFGTAPGALVADFLTLDGGGWGIDTGSQTLAATHGITLGAGGGTFGTSSATINTTINSPITGVGGLTVAGLAVTHTLGANLVLANSANDYAGATTISTGLIRLGASNVIPDGAGKGNITVNGNLDLNSFNETINGLNGSGSVSNNAASGSSTLTVGNNDASGAYTGTTRQSVGATLAIVKTGSGTQDFGGAGTFTGGFSHNGGTVRVNSTTSLGAANGAVTLANGVTLSTTAGTARTLTYAWTVNGNVTLGQAAGGTAALTLAGTMDLGGGTRALTLDNASDTISAIISNGGLVKNGIGGLTLSGGNTFAGGVTFNTGVITINNASALGTGLFTVNSGATAIGAGGSQGTVTVLNNMLLNAGAAPIVRPAGGTPTTVLELAGVIAGDGRLIRGLQAGAGAGQVVISGNNTFSGGITHASHTLVLGHKNAFGTGTYAITSTDIAGTEATTTAPTIGASTDLIGPTAVANAVTIATNFTVSATSSALEMSGPVTLLNQTSTITVSSVNPFRLSGTVSGSVGLTKAGTGALTLSGANTYSGDTTVTAGKLVIANTTGSALGSGNLILNGGTVSGPGSFTGSMTVNSGATIAPGSSPGTLNTGSQTWNGGGIYQVEIGNATGVDGVDIDQVNITGGLNIAATAGSPFVVDLTSASQPANFSDTGNYTWVIAKTTGGITGFDSSVFTISTNNFNSGFSSIGGFFLSQQGNNLVLGYTAVPEPSTIGLGIFGGAALGFMLIRRRK
jgi:fibronectin-binding autotransporter adhesin